jgi:hypothetical protein
VRPLGAIDFAAGATGRIALGKGHLALAFVTELGFAGSLLPSAGIQRLPRAAMARL